MRKNDLHDLTPKAGPLDDPRWKSDEDFWRRMNDQHLMKEFLEMQKASFNRMFGHNAAQARVRIARELRRRGITKIPNIFGDIQVNSRRRGLYHGRARKNPPAVRIYGKVLRIEAQKTGAHNCDAACEKAGHRYFHDFKVKPEMFGLDDGSLLIKK